MTPCVVKVGSRRLRTLTACSKDRSTSSVFMLLLTVKPRMKRE